MSNPVYFCVAFACLHKAPLHISPTARCSLARVAPSYGRKKCAVPGWPTVCDSLRPDGPTSRVLRGESLNTGKFSSCSYSGGNFERRGHTARKAAPFPSTVYPYGILRLGGGGSATEVGPVALQTSVFKELCLSQTKSFWHLVMFVARNSASFAC